MEEMLGEEFNGKEIKFSQREGIKASLFRTMSKKAQQNESFCPSGGKGYSSTQSYQLSFLPY